LEIIGLRLDELSFDGTYLELRVRGKGRKQRGLLLWKEVADAVRAWLAVRGDALVPEVLLNARSRALSRWGCRYVLAKHVAATTIGCAGEATDDETGTGHDVASQAEGAPQIGMVSREHVQVQQALPPFEKQFDLPTNRMKSEDLVVRFSHRQ
jgi:hypothetical protein